MSVLLGVVVVVLYLAGVASFFAPAKEPIAEHARLLENRGDAAAGAYEHVRLAAAARRSPAEVRPSTVAGVPVLLFEQYSERAMLLVQPYGRDLYVGWTMWRSRSTATLLLHFLRDTFGRFAPAPRFSAELRAAATRALRESVHSLSREGVAAALQASGPEPETPYEPPRSRARSAPAPRPPARPTAPQARPEPARPPHEERWPESEDPHPSGRAPHRPARRAPRRHADRLDRRGPRRGARRRAAASPTRTGVRRRATGGETADGRPERRTLRGWRPTRRSPARAATPDPHHVRPWRCTPGELAGTRSRPDPERPDRNLALELVRVTEAAAMAAGRYVGRGDKNGGDGAAVDAMRKLIGSVSMRGTVVIGEGEKDEAPMLFNGEQVGNGDGPECDVAVDPVDGTTLMAKGMPNALAVLAVAERGAMFDPSAVFYMEKLAVGPECRRRRRHRPPRRGEPARRGQGQGHRRLRRDGRACSTGPGTSSSSRSIRDAGARIRFISDGDVAGAIAAARPESGVDMLLGIGGTPEGIITAAAIACIGGSLQAKLWPQGRRGAREGPRGRPRPRPRAAHRRPRARREHLLLRHRRHQRRPAARRALPRRRGVHPVARDALEVRHRADDRRLAPPARSCASTPRSTSGHGR